MIDWRLVLLSMLAAYVVTFGLLAVTVTKW